MKTLLIITKSVLVLGLTLQTNYAMENSDAEKRDLLGNIIYVSGTMLYEGGWQLFNYAPSLFQGFWNAKIEIETVDPKSCTIAYLANFEILSEEIQTDILNKLTDGRVSRAILELMCVNHNFKNLLQKILTKFVFERSSVSDNVINYCVTTFPNIEHLRLKHLALSLQNHIPNNQRCNPFKFCQYLGRLTNITVLTLPGNGNIQNLFYNYPFFPEEVTKPLENLTKLVSLDLSERFGFDRDELKFLLRLTNLKSLNIRQKEDEYRDNYDGLKYLTNLINLTELDLSNKTGFSSIEYLSGLTNITQLDLSNCISLKSTEGLTRLINLTDLNVYRNCLLYKKLTSLTVLTKLKRLVISNDAFTLWDDGEVKKQVAILQEELNGLKIIYE